MSDLHSLPEQIEIELVLSELWAAAEYLDAVDAGSTPVNPTRYQAAASLARQILSTYQHPQLARLCSMSWALGEIEENLRFEKHTPSNAGL